MARNNFLGTSKSATLGRYNFGFMWGAVACLFLSMMLFCVGGATSGSKEKSYTGKSGGKKGGRNFMGRRKTVHNRGSFVDSESQKRVVKDEYITEI